MPIRPAASYAAGIDRIMTSANVSVCCQIWVPRRQGDTNEWCRRSVPLLPPELEYAAPRWRQHSGRTAAADILAHAVRGPPHGPLSGVPRDSSWGVTGGWSSHQGCCCCSHCGAAPARRVADAACGTSGERRRRGGLRTLSDAVTCGDACVAVAQPQVNLWQAPTGCVVGGITWKAPRHSITRGSRHGRTGQPAQHGREAITAIAEVNSDVSFLCSFQHHEQTCHAKCKVRTIIATRSAILKLP
jgi:hypothetical protein